MSVVMSKAAAFAAKPPSALRKTKALLRGHGPEIAARMEAENKIVAAALDSPEFKEGATAFFEKREPKWEGR